MQKLTLLFAISAIIIAFSAISVSAADECLLEGGEPSVLDACGICGGDGSTCCNDYAGVPNSLWDYVLLPEAVGDLIERFETTQAVLEWIRDNLPEERAVSSDMRFGEIAAINKKFLSGCLESFCTSSGDFLGSLKTVNSVA